MRVPEGGYYCRPEVEGVGFLLPSYPTTVEPYGSYRFETTCDSKYLSDLSVRCAQEGDDTENTENRLPAEIEEIERNISSIRDLIMDTSQVRLNGTFESSNPPVENTEPPFERTNPPTESSDPPTEDSLPVWVYILAATGGVLLVGGTSVVLLAAAYCYRRKLKTRAKHTADNRQG